MGVPVVPVVTWVPVVMLVLDVFSSGFHCTALANAVTDTPVVVSLSDPAEFVTIVRRATFVPVRRLQQIGGPSPRRCRSHCGSTDG